MSEKGSDHPSAEKKTGARLCYVDDSRTAAFVMRRMLEPGGYQVDYFQSAEPAVVALIQDDYDLLLTDLKVSSSGMDGDDLIRTLRQSGQPRLSQLPIIVITGATDAEVLVKAYDAGANQVMTKPVDTETLHSHIRRLLLDDREPPAEPERAPREPETVPLITAIQPVPPAAGSKDKKAIPVLQAASAPVKGGADAAPSAEAATPPPQAAEDKPLSMIERAVATQTPPAAGVAPKPVTDIRRQAGGDEPSWQASGPADPAKDVEEPKESRGEAEPFVFDGVPSPSSRRRWRLLSGTTLLLLLVLTLLGVAAYEGKQLYFGKGVAVQTIFPETGEIYQSIVVPGRVVSRQQEAIHAVRAGRLTMVRVQTGDRVQAGQLLARLDEQELLAQLAQAQTELATAREDIRRAEQTWESLRRAHEKGTVAEQFVKDAEMKLRVARARAGVVMREARDASLALQRQSITAPFAGTVLGRQAEVGQWITPATPLFVLADETQHEIEVQVTAADSRRILEGQIALISSDIHPGREWQEQVIRLGDAVDRAGTAGPMKVFISLGAEAPDLRLGQAVDVEILTAWSPHAIKVPIEALLQREDRVYLAVLEDGRVRLKPVITGIEDFTMAEILQGLGGQEEIILPRGHLLHDGDRVYRLADRD